MEANTHLDYMSPAHARGYYLAEHVARQEAEPTSPASIADQSPSPSSSAGVSAIRRQHAAADAAMQAEAEAHLHKGDRFAAEGKPGVARVHYRMALRRASGDLKAQIESRLQSLGGSNK